MPSVLSLQKLLSRSSEEWPRDLLHAFVALKFSVYALCE